MRFSGLFIWGVVALVVIALVGFGVLAFSTNLFVALGIGLVVVGIAKLFQASSNPAVGFVLMGLGGALFFLDGMTTLTVGDVASFVGVGP